MARLLAFYLPQFHPVPVNDLSSGPGFTEWHLVAGARPLFPGHRQPQLPGELGFYDLRSVETRIAQADLARDHGIEAFCYWHYWSLGERLLERPFTEVVDSGEPGFPFCLAWANHDWAPVWGPKKGVRIFEQRYGGSVDDDAHFAALESAFHDPRYVTVDGAPVFFVFRPGDIPDIGAFAERWRALADRSGLPSLHLVGQGRGRYDIERRDELNAALDAMVQVDVVPPAVQRPPWVRLVDRVRGGPLRFDYASIAHLDPAMADWADRCYPCVLTNWDNTPRTDRDGIVVLDPDPQLLEELVGRALALVADRPDEHQLVFIKSWNEWAEGNYVEPDEATGRARLEAIAAATGVRLGTESPG